MENKCILSCTGPGTTWANMTNFGMNLSPGVGYVDRMEVSVRVCVCLFAGPEACGVYRIN